MLEKANQARGGSLSDDALFFFFHPPQHIEHDGSGLLPESIKRKEKEKTPHLLQRRSQCRCRQRPLLD